MVEAKIQTVEDIYQLVWAAVANKQPMRAIYKGHPRLFCPSRARLPIWWGERERRPRSEPAIVAQLGLCSGTGADDLLNIVTADVAFWSLGSAGMDRGSREADSQLVITAIARRATGVDPGARKRNPARCLWQFFLPCRFGRASSPKIRGEKPGAWPVSIS